MTRLVVTGNKGQVALSLLDRAAAHGGVEVVALGRPLLDLEQPERVAAVLASARPDIIVNAAAYTAVDKAESEEALAMAINRDGAGAVATAAQTMGVPLVHLSTDYVFDGSKGLPYVEMDSPNPINAYGRSKLAGEIAVRAACSGALILRTAWVYSPFGSNFVKTMLRLGTERPVLRVVNDQLGNPTSALDLASALLSCADRLARDPISGLLHAAGGPSTSWHGFANRIFQAAERRGQGVPQVDAIPTRDFPTPAQRPRDARLSSKALFQALGVNLANPEGVDIVVDRLLRT